MYSIRYVVENGDKSLCSTDYLANGWLLSVRITNCSINETLNLAVGLFMSFQRVKLPMNVSPITIHSYCRVSVPVVQ